MAIFWGKNNSLLKLLLIMSLGICSYSTRAQNLENITLTVTFESAPIDYSVIKAPLKFNKRFALSMQIDDGNSSIYEYGFPVFEGGTVDDITYPGMTYSDGCDNLHSFKMASAIYMFTGTGVTGDDVHINPGSDIITWQQLDTLYQNQWGIANKGVNSNSSTVPEFMNYSIARNKSYCRRKMYNSTPGGVMTNIFVNPAGNSNWSDPAFNLGNIAALNQNSLTPLGAYGGNVNDPAINWAENKYNLNRLSLDDTDVKALADSLAISSINGANFWGIVFTSSLTNDYLFNDFVNDFNYIANVYGSNIADEILMTSDEEILDYLIVRDAITLNENLAGNILTLTFAGNLPDNLLHYASSIVINSDATISDISVEGTDDFTFSGLGVSEGLINFNWDGYSVPSAETFANNYTSTAVSTQTEYDALIAMDYVSVLGYGEVKNNMVLQLCEIPDVTWDEGFCNSGYPDFVLITGDSIISVGDDATLTATGFMESYLWSTGQETQSIIVSPQADTKYWVDAVTKYGNDVSDTITVIVSDSYIIRHSPLYINHIMGVQDSLWVELKEGASSLWSTGSTDNYILVDPNGSTTFHLDVYFNSEIVNQLDFIVYMENFIEFTFDRVCYGETTTLINTSVVNDTITKVLWDLNGDTQFNDAEGDTVQYVFSSSGNHLVGMRVYFKTDPMDVEYNPVTVGDVPTVNFSYENTCLGLTTIFYGQATAQVGVPNSWLWHFGDGNTDSFKNTTNYYDNAGYYNVMLVAGTSAGCKDSLQKTIQISASPTIELKTSNDIIINNYDTAFFSQGGTVTISVANFAVYDSVIWFDDSRAASVIIAEEGSFTVTAFKNGCTATIRFYTSWGGSPHPTGDNIMNLFTPNGDGYNDVWIVYDPEIIPPTKVTVFNRSGKQVYGNNNYQNFWDGQYNGNPLPQATYYYIIEDATGKIFKGAVTIIR